MILDATSRNWREKEIREWLLLLLRFAITREPADRTAVQSLAYELDKLGLSSTAPTFFRRTSEEVCAAIRAPRRAAQVEVLRKHIGRIPDRALQRAFAAALGLEPTRSPLSMNKRRRKHTNLWRGLAGK
jgi:hypothetical protein